MTARNLPHPASHYAAILRPWTVWRFESPLSGEVFIVARPSEVGEGEYQHAYQRILWTGNAYNAEESMRAWKTSAGA